MFDRDAVVHSTKSPAIKIATENQARPSASVPLVQQPNKVVTILTQNTTDDGKLSKLIAALNAQKVTTPLRMRVTRPTITSYLRNTAGVKQAARPTATRLPQHTLTQRHTPPRNATKFSSIVHKHKVTSHKEIAAILADTKSKDSKELKVQFVLDCDLKDSLQKGQLPINVPNAVNHQYLSNGQLAGFSVPSYSSAHLPSPANNPYSVPIVKSPSQYPVPSVISATRRKPIGAVAVPLATSVPNIKHIHHGVESISGDAKPAKKEKEKKKKKKPKSKHNHHAVHSKDPVVIEAIKETFAKIYSFFEEAFTTTYVSKHTHHEADYDDSDEDDEHDHDNGHEDDEDDDDGHKKKKKPKKPKKKKKKKKTELREVPSRRKRPIVKRSTITESFPMVTQPTDMDGNQKQKLTTHIHVTSEYLEPKPQPPPPTSTSKPPRRDSDEDDYFGDYYGDDDDGDDDDDIDDDEDDDDDEGMCRFEVEF